MTSTAPSPGPYFVSFMDGRLMPAYRIYEDTYETFVQVRPRLGMNMRADFNPNSPLIINSREVKHPTMRLTSTQSTFSLSNGKNLPLPIHTGYLNHLSIAIPSRLQIQPKTPERPLAGLRFSVKDIFYINGLGSPSLGSRAWVSIRDQQFLEKQKASNKVAEGIVELLQEMGAVFVGRNKLVSKDNDILVMEPYLTRAFSV